MADLIRKLLAKQGVRYVISGGTCYVADFCFFVTFYYGIHLGSGMANVCATLLSWMLNYSLSHYFVFRGQHHGIGKSLPRYMALAGFNLVVSTLLIQFLVDSVGIQGYIVKPLINILIVGWTFIAYRRFVFAHQPTEPVDTPSK